MKVIWRILVGLLAFILLLLLAAWFLPEQVCISRSVYIPKPASVIYVQIQSLRNWGKWSPWFSEEKNLTLSYSFDRHGEVTGMSWNGKSKEIIPGHIELVQSHAYDSVFMEMEFTGFGNSTSRFFFQPTFSGTILNWQMETNLGNNPLSRWFGLFTDRMVGPDLESGLNKLKMITNVASIYENIIVSEIDFSPKMIISIRDTASFTLLQSKIKKMYLRLAEKMKSRGLKTDGLTILIYHSYSDSVADIETAIPLSGAILQDSASGIRGFSPGKSVRVRYYGKYGEIATAYEVLEKYIRDKRYVVSGPGWEVYQTNTSSGIDKSVAGIDIYYPVE